MIEVQISHLAIALIIFIPSSCNSLDQDYANPAASVINLNKFGLAELTKDLSDLADLEERLNGTKFLDDNVNIEKLNNTYTDLVTTVKTESDTSKKSTDNNEKLETNLNKVREIKNDFRENKNNVSEEITIVAKTKPETTKVNVIDKKKADSKLVEKREIEMIQKTEETSNITIDSSEINGKNTQKQYSQKETEYQAKDNAINKSLINDSGDSSRKFRDTYDEVENGYPADSDQTASHNLFNKNPSIIMKTKGRCSCVDRMQKVVPDGNNFIELGSEHEEDDAFRKIQSMIFLLDSIIESAGTGTRKELGLCRKSKLVDTAAVIDNDDDKKEKVVSQIVACVKDAIKDQMSSCYCSPLPRELHSFLVWLIHGSEGGGVCPPTVQEGKSKPSYLFHEDNHRPHFASASFATPASPSASNIEVISSKKGRPVNEANNFQPQQEQLLGKQEEYKMARPSYDMPNAQPNSNSIKQIPVYQNNDLTVRRSSSESKNYYRPLRSSMTTCLQPDTIYNRSDCRNLEPKVINDINDFKYERHPGGTGEISRLQYANSYEYPQDDKFSKTIFKRDVLKMKDMNSKIKSCNKRKKSWFINKSGLTLKNQSINSPDSHIESKVEQRPINFNRQNGKMLIQLRDKYEFPSLNKKLNDINLYWEDENNSQNSLSKISEPIFERNSKYKTIPGSTKLSLKSTFRRNSKDNRQKVEEKNDSNLEEDNLNKSINHGKMHSHEEILKGTTEDSSTSGSVNMNISDLLPGIEVDPTHPNKKNKPSHYKNTTSGHPTRISLSNKQNNDISLNPNKLCYDETNKEFKTDEDLNDYPENDDSLDELEHYDDNYLEDTNEPNEFPLLRPECEGFRQTETKSNGDYDSNDEKKYFEGNTTTDNYNAIIMITDTLIKEREKLDDASNLTTRNFSMSTTVNYSESHKVTSNKELKQQPKVSTTTSNENICRDDKEKFDKVTDDSTNSSKKNSKNEETQGEHKQKTEPQTELNTDSGIAKTTGDIPERSTTDKHSRHEEKRFVAEELDYNGKIRFDSRLSKSDVKTNNPKHCLWLKNDGSHANPVKPENWDINSGRDLKNYFIDKTDKSSVLENYHVLTHNNLPVTNVNFLKIANQQNKYGRDFKKERMESLLNVSNLLQGIEMIGEQAAEEELSTATVCEMDEKLPHQETSSLIFKPFDRLKQSGKTTDQTTKACECENNTTNKYNPAKLLNKLPYFGTTTTKKTTINTFSTGITINSNKATANTNFTKSTIIQIPTFTIGIPISFSNSPPDSSKTCWSSDKPFKDN